MRLRTDDLIWQEIDQEIVALDLRSSKYFRINGSGAILWAKLAEGCSKDEMVETLTEEFTIDEATATADIDAFVERLESLDMVVSKD